MQMIETGGTSTSEEATLHDYDTMKRYQLNLIEAVRLEYPQASDKEIVQVAKHKELVVRLCDLDWQNGYLPLRVIDITMMEEVLKGNKARLVNKAVLYPDTEPMMG